MRPKSDACSPMLALRNSAHKVAVIVPNGSTQAVLGTKNPEETDRRAAHSQHFGGPRSAPRQQLQASIEIALPIRSQTVLLNQLPEQTQTILNGGIGDQSHSRRADESSEESLSLPE